MKQIIVKTLIIAGIVAILGCKRSPSVSETEAPPREQESNQKEETPLAELEEERARQAELLKKRAIEAAEREKKNAIIAEALAFLNAANFEFSTDSESTSYTNFRYNEADKALDFFESQRQTRGYSGIWSWRLFLKTASPVINTKSREYMGQPATVLLINCHWKNQYAGSEILQPVTKTQIKQLLEFDWESDEPAEESKPMKFFVSPEMAPRVIAALTDLLEVSGVKVPKY